MFCILLAYKSYILSDKTLKAIFKIKNLKFKN